MKRILAILLSLSLLLGITPTIAFANGITEDFTTVRDVSKFTSAIDIVYHNKAYYAITERSILTSSDGENWKVALSDQRITFEKIIVGGNRIVAIGNSRWSNIPTSEIYTSTDGETWTKASNITAQYDDCVYFDGNFYFSYVKNNVVENRTEYLVDSTNNFTTFTTKTGTYTPKSDTFQDFKLVATNDTLYCYTTAYFSKVTRLHRFDTAKGEWSFVKSADIYSMNIFAIDGELYSMVYKDADDDKYYETYVYKFDAGTSLWTELCKVSDRDTYYSACVNNRILVLSDKPDSYQKVTYVSNQLNSQSEISFAATEADVGYYANARYANGKYYFFQYDKLPIISTDLTSAVIYDGDVKTNELKMAIGNNKTLMVDDGYLYSFDSTAHTETKIHESEDLMYQNVFFINGLFYIFAVDYSVDYGVTKLFTTVDGVTLEANSDLEINPTKILNYRVYGDTRWLIVENDGSVSAFISVDNAPFERAYLGYGDGETSNPCQNVADIAYSNGVYAAVEYDRDSDSTYLLHSTDGLNYEIVPISSESFRLNGVIFAQDKFIAYGLDGIENGVAIFTSTDGVNYEQQTQTIQEGMMQLIAAPNGFYGIVEDGNDISIVFSKDGKSFETVKSNLYYGDDYDINEYKYVHGNYRFAVGDEVLYAYSLDGMIYKKSIEAAKKYTVRYDLNGGNGTLPPIAEYTAGMGFTVTSLTPTKENYAFKGWSDGKATYQNSVGYPASTIDVTLKAVWEENPKYTVSYDANGGDGTLPENTMYYVNTGFTITNTIPTRENHTFIGWNDGKNTYQKGAAHPGSTKADIALTAQWQEHGKYAVTYNLNGGSGAAPVTQNYYVDTGFTVTDFVPTRQHYDFLGWSDGSKTYSTKSEYPSTNKNVTLTAQWREHMKYSLSYDFNGGTGTLPDVQSLYAGENITVAAAPIRTDYIFKGFSDGKNLYQPNDKYTVPIKNTTLTAQWEKIPTYTASFSGGTGATGQAPESKVLAKGKAFVLPENTFTKKDYDFIGWSDGKKTYPPMQSYSMPEGGVTFTAEWKHNPEYKVYVSTADEFMDAIAGAPYGGKIGTIILENDIVFAKLNFRLSNKNDKWEKQNIVIDLQNHTLDGGDGFGQHYTNYGNVKITGTKEGMLRNSDIYSVKSAKLTIENIRVEYIITPDDTLLFIENEGTVILNNCDINLNHEQNECTDDSEIVGIRNYPSGEVYINSGTHMDIHRVHHEGGGLTAQEAHKDGKWIGIYNMGTVRLQGGTIHSAGPAIYNSHGIYFGERCNPILYLTEGELDGAYPVTKSVANDKDELIYTCDDYILSKGSYIDIGAVTVEQAIFSPNPTMVIKKHGTGNYVMPDFRKNLNGEFVYPQNEPAKELNFEAVGVGLKYAWYRNVDNSIIGATKVSNSERYTPPTDNKGVYYYFLLATSTQSYEGKFVSTYLISNSAKITVIAPLSDEPIELKHYTGIRLNADEKVLPENTVMKITPVTEGGNFELVSGAMNEIADKFAAFDITLLSDGVEIQPNGKVKIRIPIPKDFGTDNLIVYRVNEDGSKTPYTVKVVDGFAEFETDHFSLYVLAVKAKADTSKTESPQTGDNLTVLPFAILASLSGLTIIGLIVNKKRYRIKKH